MPGALLKPRDIRNDNIPLLVHCNIFTIAKVCKQPKCPSMDERMTKMRIRLNG